MHKTLGIDRGVIVQSYCVWDRPHIVLDALKRLGPPNDADLLELTYRYSDDPSIRKKILVDNPARLFGFTFDGTEREI